MDFSAVQYQLWNSLWYLLPLAVLAVVFKSAWFKGLAGEFVVHFAARMFLDKNKYHLLRNVTLRTEDGTTQIDHIIVSEHGVFVLETKNMKGWIFGRPEHKTWTQKIYKHSAKFQNPLHQNYKHVRTLMSLLEVTEQQCHSLVVFVGESVFKTDMPGNVTHCRGFIRFIKSKNEKVLSTVEVEQIIRKIEQIRLAPSRKTDREHVRNLRQRPVERNEDTLCPDCGSRMVVRVTKRGPSKGLSFWGCTRFPKCRAIVNIS